MPPYREVMTTTGQNPGQTASPSSSPSSSPTPAPPAAPSSTPSPAATERADLVQALRRHRDFLRFTVRDIDDEQARRRTTVSELTLGGLVKHVAATEKQWAEFIVDGPAPGPDIDWENVDWQDPPEHVKAFME